MVKVKDVGVGFLVDSVTVGICALVWWLHAAIASLHPIIDVMRNTTKDMMMNNPELMPDTSVLATGVLLILFLIILSLVITFVLVVVSRAGLYSYYSKGKFKIKDFKKNLKVVFSGLVLAYIPIICIAAIVLLIIGILMYSIGFTFKSEFIVDAFKFPLSYVETVVLVIFGAYYYYALHTKKIFANYGKFLETIGKKWKFILVQCFYVFLVVLFMYFVQTTIIAKIPFMYNFDVVWFFVFSFLLIAYLRLVGIEVVKKVKH